MFRRVVYYFCIWMVTNLTTRAKLKYNNNGEQ